MIVKIEGEICRARKKPSALITLLYNIIGYLISN
jgi:hypothetical protein